MTRARETTMQADLTHFGFVFAFANDQSATLREAAANILQFWYAIDRGELGAAVRYLTRADVLLSLSVDFRDRGGMTPRGAPAGYALLRSIVDRAMLETLRVAA
jgi:hypothetical protein